MEQAILSEAASPVAVGITLGLSHFIAIAGVLITAMGGLITVIKVLWTENQRKDQELRATDKAILPIVTQITSILDDHNSLDAERASLIPLLKKIIETNKAAIITPELLSSISSGKEARKKILQLLEVDFIKVLLPKIMERLSSVETFPQMRSQLERIEGQIKHNFEVFVTSVRRDGGNRTGDRHGFPREEGS